MRKAGGDERTRAIEHGDRVVRGCTRIRRSTADAWSGVGSTSADEHRTPFITQRADAGRVVHRQADAGRDRAHQDVGTKEPVREGKEEGAHACERPRRRGGSQHRRQRSQGGQAQAGGDDAGRLAGVPQKQG